MLNLEYFQATPALFDCYFKSLLKMEEYEPWTTKPEDENVVVEIKSATFGWNEVIFIFTSHRYYILFITIAMIN